MTLVSVPLLEPEEGLILVIEGSAATGLTKAMSRSTPARHAKKCEPFIYYFPSFRFYKGYGKYAEEPGGFLLTVGREKKNQCLLLHGSGLP